ncbi:hypothetical protein ACHAXN_006693 [Cyclotella atomus]
MAGLSFLAKKSWHTSNLSNQEKVWLAEQKAAAEAQKVKELQTQIQLEREKEEFEKLAGKKSKGDRGVNWMYEEGRGPAYGENNTEAKEEEEKEAYLLGKEYVPKGQERHVGDFAEAAAMGAVLEKASTRGATIGVGEAGGAAGASSRGGDAVVHLKDDNEEQIKDDDGRSEFNREFHLRHEDPMFAVHQKREMQRKDAEKKRHLMEKAGLVVKEVERGDAERERPREHERDYDRKTRKDRSRKRKKHHKHRHTRDRSSWVSSRSSSSSRERRHRKKHRHHSRKHERRRDRSTSRDRSVDRHNDDGRGNDSRREDRHRDRYDHGDDKYERHHHERHRERSRSRDRGDGKDKVDRDEKPRHHHRHHKSYNNDDDGLDEFGRKRHDSSDERRGSGSHRDRDKDEEVSRNRRRKDSSSDRDRQSHHKDKEVHPPKKEGYGLIGTSLSGNGRNTSSNSAGVNRPASLGPDSDRIAAKRREVERERQSKLDQSRRRWDRDGHSREQALEEFERNARDRR